VRRQITTTTLSSGGQYLIKIEFTRLWPPDDKVVAVVHYQISLATLLLFRLEQQQQQLSSRSRSLYAT
jgi:hypothetical protein